MVLTYQAVVIVLGIGAMIRPSWPATILFVVALAVLATKENLLDRASEPSDQPSDSPAPPIQWNEDAEGWDA